jgi:hypothetical protein
VGHKPLQGKVNTLEAWRTWTDNIPHASKIWLVQLSPRWFTDPAWASVRDHIDLELFRSALTDGDRLVYRRLLLYRPPSDLGGAAYRFQEAKLSHDAWIARVRRQLAVLGAEGSAGRSESCDVDYLVRQVLLPRVGTEAIVKVSDGMWLDEEPPQEVRDAWGGEGPIPMDPHEENIVGPFADRNPLWAGNAGLAVL